ncbi:MFS transporter [Rhodococcus sp. HNM0569]|uniref:MFS transporter n=1 Tax=Rhodococcus sp. HNM0569 TaxID=2716340 RepID=UPI00146B5CBC|nr:MFS transporter [Rhodococcus sp. HNM0569]NLU82972.1 MFS transporter [Rhodococcus sp. HNM0569]
MRSVAGVARGPGLLRTPGLLTAMVMAAAAFGGFALLLPVVPLTVSDAGGGDAVAGAVTATFMAATVATQLGTPALLRRCGHRVVLAAGCIALGLPSLVLVWSALTPVVLAVSAVRGVGFGLLTVASSALVAELVAPERLGRASGLQGIAIAATQMAGLPAGLALYHRFGAVPAIVVGAVVPVLALAAIARLPTLHPRHRPRGGARLPFAALAYPLTALGAAAVAYGAVASLLPIAVSQRATLAGALLAVVSGAMLVGRYSAGTVSDRFGPGRVVAPAAACATVGLALLALAVAVDPVAAVYVLGAVAFGLGFGAVQNDSLVMVFALAGPGRTAPASAAWNIGFDAGTGLGSLSLGVVAAVAGYPWMLVVAACVVALAPTVVALATLGARRDATALRGVDRVES